MRHVVTILACLLICSAGSVVAQPEPELVADLRPGIDSSTPQFLTGFDGALYFSAVRDDVGRELWTYDGSAVNLAADIRPGTSGSFPDPNRDYNGLRFGFTEYDGGIFFSAIGESGQFSTWKYDGTSLVAISENAGTHFVVYDDELLYSPIDGNSPDPGLLRYDGTIIEQIPEYCGTPCNRYFYDYEPYGDELYFAGGTLHTHLVAYDGVEVRFKAAFPSRMGTGADPEFVVYQEELYFAADDGTSGSELWKWDGSSATQVTNINPGGDANPNFLTVYDERLCFAAENPDTGIELWCYDGQTTTPYELNPGSGSGQPDARRPTRAYNDRPFVEYKGKLYFSGFGGDSSEGLELWSFDGNAVSLVADINTGGASSPKDFLLFDDKLYFSADESSTGVELRSYDGTSVQLAADIRPGFQGSRPEWLTTANGALYFTANDGETGVELWKLDGPTNSPPVASDDIASTQEETPVEIDVRANDSDPDGDTLVLDSYTQPQNGLVTNDAGILTYTPDTGFSGNDKFVYTVVDGNGGSATATVTVTVLPASLTLNVSEQVTVDDSPRLLPGLTLAISESVTVSDQPELLPGLLLTIAEGISVDDGPMLRPSVLLRITEDVTVSDAPEFLERLLLSVMETIEVTDNPELVESLLLSVTETVEIVDDIGLLSALLLRIEESIAVEDGPTVLTAEDLVQILAVSIQELAANGSLVRGQSRSLLQKLARILDQYENGRYRTASNQLRAFVSQVKSFREDGILTDQEADAFLAQADAIATAISQESHERAGKQSPLDDEFVDAQASVPDEFALAPAYPNPFNPVTTITYSLPEQVHVNIAVYDVLGQRVALLVDQGQSAGSYAVPFNARDLPSGSYVVQITAGAHSGSRSITLVK